MTVSCHFVPLLLLLVLAEQTSGNKYYSHGNGQQQTIIEDPSDQQVKVGDKALLKCRVKNLRGEPQWCIDDFCLGVSKNLIESGNHSAGLSLKGRPRYRIIGDRSRGEFDLLIEPVQLQDNMFFYCMVTAASETIKAVKSKKVFLTVLAHPQSLHLDNPVHVSLNKPSSIQCVAKQSRPPVKILIAINGQLITDESRYKTEVVQYPAEWVRLGRYDAESQLNESIRFTVPTAKPIDGHVLRESYYDTITNVTIDDVTIRMEGQNVECFAYSFVNWNSNGNQANINNNIRYLMHSSNKNVNSIHNNVMSVKSMIQVDYAPEVNLKIVSSNRVLKEDDVISLVCETRATPAIQSYKWYIGNSYLSGVVDSSLNLKLRKEMHMKTITCEASNTVASVKASIHLDILFKPSFVKGSQSYIQVDKSTCNKPLTLDCQVNSNPSSNITWYRRRLGRDFVAQFLKLDKRGRENLINTLNGNKMPSLARFGFHGLNADIFQDEPIGTGPTYTIASFNCANALSNLKNKTRTSISSVKTKIENLVKPNDDVNSSDSRRLSQRDKNSQPPPQEAYSDETEDPSEYNNNDYEQVEYYVYEDEMSDAGSLGNNYKSSQDVDYGNDFGIYICEARNNLPNPASLFYSSRRESNDDSVERRYIKLNPTGTPVSHPLSMSSSYLPVEQLVKFLMKDSVSDAFTTLFDQTEQAKSPLIIEIPVTLGSSVSLTCLVEPLPVLDTLIWVKDNGRVIANSRYTAHGFKPSGEASKFSNFKIKHENLTLIDPTKPDFVDVELTREAEEAESNTSDMLMNSDLLLSNGIKIVDGKSVSLFKSVLFVKKVGRDDLGVYKCKSINAYGGRTIGFLVREKTLFDKLNLGNYMSMAFLLSLAMITIILFILFVLCLVSRQARRMFCCCCCSFYSTKPYDNDKEKKLLQCELNSNKVISDWLASSKLNDTSGNSSLVNTSSNPAGSSSTGMTILNGPDLVDSSSSSTTTTTAKILSSASSNASTKPASSSGEQSLANSPNHNLPDEMMMVVGASLLNDENSSERDTMLKGRTGKRVGHYYKNAPQLSKLLISTSDITKSTMHRETDLINNDDDEDETQIESNKNSLLATSGATNKLIFKSSSPSINQSSLLRQSPHHHNQLKSHNLTNGNFNAKISTKIGGHGTYATSHAHPKLIMPNACLTDHDPMLDSSDSLRFNKKPTILQHQFNNFTLSPAKYEDEIYSTTSRKEYYDNTSGMNSQGGGGELDKMISETTIRLTDLFSGLNSNTLNRHQQTNPTSNFISNTNHSNTLNKNLLVQTAASNAAANGQAFNKFPMPFASNTLTHTTNRIYNKNNNSSNNNVYCRINDLQGPTKHMNI